MQNKFLHDHVEVLNQTAKAIESKIYHHPKFSNWDIISQDYVLSEGFISACIQYQGLQLTSKQLPHKHMMMFIEKSVSLKSNELLELVNIMLFHKYLPPKNGNWLKSEAIEIQYPNESDKILLVTTILSPEDSIVIGAVPLSALIEKTKIAC